MYSYCSYNNRVYKLTLDDEAGNTCEKVQLMYEPHGDEGKKATFKSTGDDSVENGEWTILYDYGDYVEILSPTVFELSSDSSGYHEQKPVRQSSVISEVEADKAFSSYNNAITGLNKYCEKLITNKDKISVRSVGSNPYNPSSESSKLYTSDVLQNAGYGAGYCNSRAKCGDLNFEQDLVRMSYYNVVSANDPYLLASRIIRTYNYYVSFCLNSVGKYGTTDKPTEFIWANFSGSSGSGVDFQTEYSIENVRPVVKISKDKLNIIEEE